ncbi:MAG: VCBS repeat-containing protein [Planctomycetes bacterium]|nr:VCBS repeat-containing protein [Planctomycetota bacterium]MBI3843756.1 VCBS repeat-containing protein [Planctomycetota bacterium]
MSSRALVAFATLLLPAVLASAQVDFASVRAIDGRRPSQSFVVADFNHDGLPDVVSAAGAATLLLGTCERTLRQSFVSAFIGAGSVAVADLDEDGNLDFAVTNTNANRVHVFFGDGTGGFPRTFNFVPGGLVGALAAADFDGAHMDLAVTDVLGSVVVMFNNGHGSFPSSATIAMGSPVTEMLARDVNDDGYADLICTSRVARTVIVRLGDGNGGFGPVSSFPCGRVPVHIAAGDFDRDGHLDFALASESTDIAVILGDGMGSFGAPQSHETVVLSYFVGAGDIDGDGKLDLFCSDPRDDRLSILYGDGGGGFGAPQFATWVFASAVDDFDRDGIPDILCGDGLLLGRGSGLFEPSLTFPAGSVPRGIALGDFDEDGHLDVAAANPGVAVLFGDGAGQLGPPIAVAGGRGARAIVAAHFDGDEHLDLATANTSRGDVSILLGSGTGSFAPARDFPAIPDSSGLAAADLDGDGFVDLVVSSPTADAIGVLLGNGTGSFGATTSIGVGDQPTALVVANIDGDSVPDIAVANTMSGDVTILIGNSSGGFTNFGSFPAGEYPQSIAAADVDGDGVIDLLVGNGSIDRQSLNRAAFLLRGDGSGSFASAAIPGVAARWVDVADLDGDGRLDLVCGPGGLSIHAGDEARGFHPDAVGFGSLSLDWFALALGDLEEDGRPDVVVSEPQLHQVRVLRNRSSNASAGSVNAANGPRFDSLRVDGSRGSANRRVTVAPHTSFRLSLDASPSGPTSARYVVWAWSGCSSRPTVFRTHGSTLGTIVNPTPLQRGARPQPFRCLRGGIPSAVCSGVLEVPSPPAHAPWSVTVTGGLRPHLTVTLQGILEDAGAANPTGFSVTNAIVIDVP